jgi:hypothetical protein
VFPDALPDQPGAADLGDGGEGEEQQRTRDVTPVILAGAAGR